jgi:hypothetical protein
MIKGDSTEYDLLESACKLVPWPEVLSAEIGVRQGQGSKIILDSFKDKTHWHIGIDPYGNLDYQHYDTTGTYTCDYTNSMKLQLLQDLSYEHFTLYSIGDDEFMKRFADGVPIYRNTKKISNTYDLVHFDGPHKTIDVIRETMFFGDRARIGSVFVYDDYPKYDMNVIGTILVEYLGFEPVLKGDNKIALQKKKDA